MADRSVQEEGARAGLQYQSGGRVTAGAPGQAADQTGHLTLGGDQPHHWGGEGGGGGQQGGGG